jgi:hypothetical protein
MSRGRSQQWRLPGMRCLPARCLVLVLTRRGL